MNLCYAHRLNDQLKGIAHCLRTSLASVTDSPWEYVNGSLIAASSDENSDHLARSEQSLTLSLKNGAWLKVAPLAPGGLICDDLLIQSDCRSFSTLQKIIRESGFTGRPACTMTSEQFHSRFRPDSQGHAPQADKSKHRILIMMPDASEGFQDSLFINKIHTLLETLISTPGQTSIECLHKDTFGATQGRKLLSQLKARKPGYPRIGMTAMNPDSRNMLAVMMGNASLALCGNSGSVADAFQFGLPVALWNRTGTPNTDSINHYAVEWLHPDCRTSKSMIASEQQECWLRLHSRSRTATTMVNKSSQLSFTVEKWLSHNNSDLAQKITLHGPHAARPGLKGSMTGTDLVFSSAFPPPANPSGLQQLRTSLERKRKKFIKFRQSPTQFIEDSEVSWLRAFKHPRP